MIDINSIPAPKIIEEYSFEDIKEAIIASIKERVPGYEPLESDRYMAVIEAVAYREMIIRARVNDAIKAMLLPTATGSDLDNVIAMYAIDRRKGVKPRAKVTLSLSVALDYDVVIPAGAVFTDKTRQYFSRLVEDLIIPAGEMSADGDLELDEYVVDSAVKTEICVTPFPFVLSGKQPGDFKGGLEEESDEVFRVRAVQSLERFSTAGAVESYKYHAFAASLQVLAVHADSPAPGRVRVVIQVTGDVERAIEDVTAGLSDEKVRPFTDFVEVVAAEQKEAAISAELELFNMLEQAAVIAKIENSFDDKTWALGEDLNLSYIYKMLHVDGVYRVTLDAPAADLRVNEDEYISVTLSLTCKAAEL